MSDRLYLNAYVRVCNEDPACGFLRQRGKSSVAHVVREITNAFKTALQRLCSARDIPWIEFTKGKTRQAGRDLCQQFTADEGVVLVG